MKKNKILLFIIAIMLFLPLTVYAGGSITVNTRNLTIPLQMCKKSRTFARNIL